MPPEGDLATKLYTSDKGGVEIKIVYTSDQKTIEIEIVYTSDQPMLKSNKFTLLIKKSWNRNRLHFWSKNVEIEIVYTSDQKASKPLTLILLLFFGQYLYMLPLAHDNISFCLLPTTIFKNIARVKTDLHYTSLQY